MRTYLPAFAMSALATLAGCGDHAGASGEATSPETASTSEQSSSAPANTGASQSPLTEPISEGATPVAPRTGSAGNALPAPSAAIDGTAGGDGSAIRLGPLDGSALKGTELKGELACGFGASGAAPLLIARGDVASKDRAQALVSNGGYVGRLVAAEPGGYDAMIDGVRFGGRGLTATIVLTGAAPSNGGESPAVPATLTVDRADGARRVFSGTWTCGP